MTHFSFRHSGIASADFCPSERPTKSNFCQQTKPKTLKSYLIKWGSIIAMFRKSSMPWSPRGSTVPPLIAWNFNAVMMSNIEALLLLFHVCAYTCWLQLEPRCVEDWIPGGLLRCNYNSQVYWAEEEIQFAKIMKFFQSEFVCKSYPQRLNEAKIFRQLIEDGCPPNAAQEKATQSSNASAAEGKPGASCPNATLSARCGFSACDVEATIIFDQCNIGRLLSGQLLLHSA